jgi:hypothetical protein
MDSYKSMNRNELLRNLQKHKKYHNSSQKKIGEKLGKIDNLRNELNRLDTKTNKRLEKMSNNTLPDTVKTVMASPSLNISDLKFLIYLNLDFDSLVHACQSDKDSQQICNNPQFWEQYFVQYGFEFIPGTKNYINLFIKESLSNNVLPLFTIYSIIVGLAIYYSTKNHVTSRVYIKKYIDTMWPPNTINNNYLNQTIKKMVDMGLIVPIKENSTTYTLSKTLKNKILEEKKWYY